MLSVPEVINPEINYTYRARKCNGKITLTDNSKYDWKNYVAATFPETVIPLASEKKTMTQQSSRQRVNCHRTPPI